MRSLDDSTIIRFSQRTKLIVALLILGLGIFLTPLLFLQHQIPTEAKNPRVRIDTPLVLVRGHRCLLTETKQARKQRYPAESSGR